MPVPIIKQKCCICGPVRNCGPFLKRVLENIEKIGGLFEEYVIIISYDKSTDNSLDILNAYQRVNPRLKIFINTGKTSPYRTHNIANARNKCLDLIRRDYVAYPFFIMMDFDDVNAKNISVDKLVKYFERDDWDALSFNTSPSYYDIWALSIYPYCYSYNHFKDNVQYYSIIQTYISRQLSCMPKTQLLRCISAFNGFSIYRTNPFLKCKYDGRVRTDLATREMIQAHMRATKSKLMYIDYGNVDGRYEDCEHRPFHMEAIKRFDARIMISKDVIFY